MSPGRNDLQTDRLALLPAVVSAGAAFSADVLGAAVPLSTAPGCIRLRSVLGVDPELVESTARAVALGNTASLPSFRARELRRGEGRQLVRCGVRRGLWECVRYILTF